MPTFADATLLDHNFVNDSAHDVLIPTSLAAGDFVLLWIYANDPYSIASIGHTDDTSLWDLSAPIVADLHSGLQNAYCYGHFCDAGDISAGAFRVTFNGVTVGCFGLVGYLASTIDGTTPVDGVQVNSGTSRYPAALSITPSHAGDRLVWAAMDWNGSTAILVPAALPTGGTGAWATRVQTFGSSAMPLTVGDVALTTSGTSTGQTIGGKHNAGFWTAYAVLLAPPASGGSSGSGTLGIGRTTFAAVGQVTGGALVGSGAMAVGGVTAAAVGALSGTITATLALDGSHVFQVLDGLGVTASPWAGVYSDIAPMVDTLLNDLHASLWHVDPYGSSDWIPSTSNLNDAYYATVYESPRFLATWQLLERLYDGDAEVVLSFTGPAPSWAGGYDLLTAQEGNVAAMLASVVDWGRRVHGLPIQLVSLFDAPDRGRPQGPFMGAVQYARIATAFLARMDVLGYPDVRLLAPNLGLDADAAMYQATLASALGTRLDAWSVQSYATPADASMTVSGAASMDPALPVWVSELGQTATDGDLGLSSTDAADQWVYARETTRALLALLGQGVTAVDAREGWDALGGQTNQWSWWGLYDYSLHAGAPGGSYTPKKRYYALAQVMRFVRPGWERIQVQTNTPGIEVVAFADPLGTGISIVGYNGTGASVSFSGTLAGVTNPASLRLYRTNGTVDRFASAPVTVTAGAFTASVPSDSLFTLSTLSGELDCGQLGRAIPAVTMDATGGVLVESSGTGVLVLGGSPSFMARRALGAGPTAPGTTGPITLVAVGDVINPGTSAPLPGAVPSPVFTWIDALGSEHPLSGQPDLEVIQGRTGLFMPVLDHVEDKIPGVNGTILRDILYQPREVDLPMLVRASDFSALWTRVAEVTSWFRVNRDASGHPIPGRLRVQRPDGSQRELTCFYGGGLQGQEGAGVSGATWRRMLLQLHASDPFWHPVVAAQQTFALTTGAGFFAVPFLPIKLGLSVVSSGAPVINAGDEQVWPIWKIVGPGSNPTITNLTTGLSLTLTLNLGSTDSVTVDTRPTRKTVTNDQTHALIYSAISTGATAMWPLQPGSNNVQIVMGGATIGSRITCTFVPAYVSA